ncbi:MAG: alpha/beta fold hydrolase [Rubrobacteraceae bacterium]
MIILVLVVVVIAVAGTLLGRISQEVESARDTEYVELDGHWVRYTVIGGGPPVLLVHGWLASSRIWEQLARRLAQRFTVYSLDLTGFGESDKPTDGYGTRNGSRLLYAFCAHFGLTRATVIGHDFSGSMAVKLAADHPDIVGRLVLVATPADEEQIDLPTLLWLTTLPVVGPIFFSLGRVLKPLRKLWVRSFVFDPGDLPDELIEDAGKPTPAAAGKTYSVTRHEISGGRVARQARIIKVPMLLIAGEDDQIIDPRAVSDWGQEADQAEIVLLDKCGHLPMVESPAEFSARVLAFLTGDSRYLEYVKEVPPPPGQEPIVEEEALEEEPPELREPETEPPPEEPAVDEEERPAAKKGTDLGDVSWDFSPKKTPGPRHERTSKPHPPEPEADGAQPRRESRPATPRPTTPRSSKRATPQPENKDAEEVSPASSETQPDESRRRNEDREPGSGRIPEFPGDLFQWSKAPEDYSPERRRRRSGGSKRRDRDEDGE